MTRKKHNVFLSNFCKHKTDLIKSLNRYKINYFFILKVLEMFLKFDLRSIQRVRSVSILPRTSRPKFNDSGRNTNSQLSPTVQLFLQLLPTLTNSITLLMSTLPLYNFRTLNLSCLCVWCLARAKQTHYSHHQLISSNINYIH